MTAGEVAGAAIVQILSAEIGKDFPSALVTLFGKKANMLPTTSSQSEEAVSRSVVLLHVHTGEVPRRETFRNVEQATTCLS